MIKSKRGFTLIELMIVISILLILVSVAVPSFLKYRESSLRAKCIANLRRIQDAREAYFMDHMSVTEMTEDTALYPYLGYQTAGEGEGAGMVWTVNLADLECPAGAGTYTWENELSKITDMPTCGYSGDVEHVYQPN